MKDEFLSVTVKLPIETAMWLRTYAQQRGSYMSAALIQLMIAGALAETGQSVPYYKARWGGWRGGRKKPLDGNQE